MFQELYDKMLIDNKIADKTGYSPTTVRRWRKENNLPPRKHFEEYAFELWWGAWEDTDIADECNVPWQAIKAWRKANKLESNEGLLTWNVKKKVGRPKKDKTEADEMERRERRKELERKERRNRYAQDYRKRKKVG